MVGQKLKNRNIKVLNIIIEDRIGGPHRRIVQVTKELRKAGVETVVAIPADNGDFQGLLLKENIKFYEIKGFRRPRLTFDPKTHLKYMFSLSPAILQLKKIIEQEAIDIVHQNDIKQIQGPIAAKLADVKSLWHLQGYYPFISACFIPFPYFLADQIVAASGVIGKKYFDFDRKLFKKDFKILYAPVDIDKFHPGNIPSPFKKESNFTNNYPIIGTVGNIDHIKGHKYFIQAAHLIKKKYENAKFVIVGKKLENRNSYATELENMVTSFNFSKQDFIFTGERDDIPKILGALDIFILPSLSEACPMALLEAMATELPCIASNVGGIPEIIKDRVCGLLVPPKDSKAIAQAIENLLSDPEKAEEIGKKARERVLSNFSLSICVQKHYEIYNKLLLNGIGD